VQNSAGLRQQPHIDLRLYNRLKFLNIINNAPPPWPRTKKTDSRNRATPTDDAAAAADTTREANRFVKAVLIADDDGPLAELHLHPRANGTLLPVSANTACSASTAT
jgi:hypothetical protein